MKEASWKAQEAKNQVEGLAESLETQLEERGQNVDNIVVTANQSLIEVHRKKDSLMFIRLKLEPFDRSNVN